MSFEEVVGIIAICLVGLVVFVAAIEGAVVYKRLYDTNICLKSTENHQTCLDKFVSKYYKEKE